MILLDTHSLIWWVNRDKHLSRAAASAIETEILQQTCLVSSITIWEIALLLKYRRLTLAADHVSWLSQLQSIPGLEFIPIGNAIAIEAVNLPGTSHKDPADRFIAATARTKNCPIVTADEKLRAYPHVRTIW